MMKYFFSLIILISTSVAAMEVLTPSDSAIEEMKNLALLQLKDPDSATFKDFAEVTGNGKYIRCGKVNAKNSFGGYTGFKTFVHHDSSGTWQFELDTALSGMMCNIVYKSM